MRRPATSTSRAGRIAWTDCPSGSPILQRSPRPGRAGRPPRQASWEAVAGERMYRRPPPPRPRSTDEEPQPDISGVVSGSQRGWAGDDCAVVVGSTRLAGVTEHRALTQEKWAGLVRR